MSETKTPPLLQGQKVLMLGLGHFEQQLLQAIQDDWETIVVDLNEEKVARLRERLPGVTFKVGDASSILTWKNLDVADLRYIITSFRDNDVNLEVCRIVRETLQLDTPIIVIEYSATHEERFKEFKATTVNPISLGVTIVENMLGKKYSRAVTVGMRRGEIIQVGIYAKSHLTDRKLRYIRPARWHIAAIYRNGDFIIPKGDTTMKVGDDVVLVGEPKVLENVVKILVKGVPQFPLQFGSDLVFPLHRRYREHLAEAMHVQQWSKSLRLLILPYPKKSENEAFAEETEPEKKWVMGEAITALADLQRMDISTGVLIVPATGWYWLFGFGIKTCFKQFHVPLLFSRRTFPYRGVLTSLNGPHPSLAMETAIEIARLLDVEYRALFVTLPQELRSEEEEAMLADREHIISDFEKIYKTKIPFTVLEGNPVRETIHYFKNFENQLVVMVRQPNEPIRFLRPNVPYLIAKKSRFSILIIPGDISHE
ncbi:MAG: NAD-binding protein [Acidobacteria bacterium]|nr:NAD-binding protein [Acidobacteriota bacterium]